MHGEQHLIRFLIQLFVGLGLPVTFCAACVAIAVVPNLETSRADRTRLDIANLDATARAFHLRKGRSPRSVEELVLKGFLEKMPRDPWSRPYGHWQTGEGDVFFSLGLDGMCGGEGRAADVASSGRAPSQQECQLRMVSCF